MTRRQTILFFLFCLCTSSAWLIAQALPSQLPSLAAEGFHFLLLGLAATLFCLIRKKPRPAPSSLFWTAVYGLALFAAPLVLLTAAQGMVTPAINVVVFAFLPIVVVVALGQIHWLIPALAGVAGLLVLLPVSLPATSRAYLGLALLIAAVAFTAASILVLHGQRLDAWSLTAIFLANALILFLVIPGHTPWSLTAVTVEVLRCLLITAPRVLLLLWLIPNLAPRRLAAGWLLVPLFTIIEGYLLIRPTPDSRLLLGLSLLAIGGTVLFAANDEKPQSTTLL